MKVKSKYSNFKPCILYR